MTELDLVHTTEYKYEEDVTLCHNQLLKTPRTHGLQVCNFHDIQIDPMPDIFRTRLDYFGNSITSSSIQRPHRHLRITAKSRVTTVPLSSIDLQQGATWEEVAIQMRTDNHSEMEYSLPSHFTPDLPSAHDIVERIFTPGKPVLQAAFDLCRLVFEEFAFDPTVTNILTPLSRVLRLKRGVCQDFTHLCLSIMRSKGLPARYVSGYIETLPPPGQTKLQGADASHAWFSAWCPVLGWVDFDPTNGQLRNHQYIVAALGRDYQDVSPLKGILFGGGKNKLKVSVDVNGFTPA